MLSKTELKIGTKFLSYQRLCITTNNSMFLNELPVCLKFVNQFLLSDKSM